MTFDEMCKLAAEIEVAPDGWRPVRMQRYEWGWRLHVELDGDTENTMSIATYKPWPEWRRWHHEAESLVVELEIMELDGE